MGRPALPATEKKKSTSFSLSEDTIDILKKLAKADTRTTTSMVEKLIKAEADRLKIKPSKKK